MTRIVCLICDVAKPSTSHVTDVDHCDGCGRKTANREVASDTALIAPGSALRFREQRELYQTTKPKEGKP